MDKYNKPDLMIIMRRAHISQPDGTFGMKVSSFGKDYNWVCKTFASDKRLFRSFEENKNSSLSGETMFLVLWPELNGGAGRREGLSWADHYVRVQVSPSLRTKSESRVVLRPSPSQEWS